jgi:GNAT superfamily N-acetyltransferase
MCHPNHDELVQVVRGWYTESAPEMGYLVEAREFGFYMRNVNAPSFGSVVLRELPPARVPELLADLRAYYGPVPVSIQIDDRELEARVGGALVAGGFAKGADNVYLAHVGDAPHDPQPQALKLEPVDSAGVEEYVLTKLRGFANLETDPSPDQVTNEAQLRRADLGGEGRFVIARVEHEPASIIGWYEGTDRFVFQLATRVPFRGRGIARWLLGHVIAGGYAQGCRSVILNTDPDDTPIRLYRRMGFADEIYWRCEYRGTPYI